jgi:hypothetical protein
MNRLIFVLCLLALASCGPVGSELTSERPGDYPILLSAELTSPTSVRLQWQDRSVGEDFFGVERRTVVVGGSSGTTNQDPFALVQTLGPNETTYEDLGLAPGTTYYYRVYYQRADDKSRYSNIEQVTP